MARSVVDVATYILERTDTITTMKLQKLAFYSQALHLVINGTPLFPEDFHAWRGGPVAPELYAFHRGKFLIRPGELGNAGTSEELTEEERTLIAAVCDAMSEATGADLSQRTHAECHGSTLARASLPPSLSYRHHQASNAQLLSNELRPALTMNRAPEMP